MRRTKLVARSVARDGVTLAVRDSAPPNAASRNAAVPDPTAPEAAAPDRDRPHHDTVVLITGMAAPQSVWDPVIARLGSGHRVVTYDHRGHGRSSGAENYGVRALLDDLDAVLRATTLEGSDSDAPVLCGWSMGADLAVWYAAHNPGSVRGVLALDGALAAEPENDTVSKERLRASMTSPIGRMTGWLTRILGVGHRLDPEQLQGLLDDLERWRTGILAAYAALDVPVTVALADRPTPGAPHGQDERWRAAADELAASFPEIDLRWLDCDHAIPLRVPEQVADLLRTVSART